MKIVSKIYIVFVILIMTGLSSGITPARKNYGTTFRLVNSGRSGLENYIYGHFIAVSYTKGSR